MPVPDALTRTVSVNLSIRSAVTAKDRLRSGTKNRDGRFWTVNRMSAHDIQGSEAVEKEDGPEGNT